MKPLSLAVLFALLSPALPAKLLFEDSFDSDSPSVNTGPGGGLTSQSNSTAAWEENGNLTFNAGGSATGRRAFAYSSQAFQSDTGFKLTAHYTLGNLADSGENSFSFGLVAADPSLAGYTGLNPIGQATTLDTFGVNLTKYLGKQGLISTTNGTTSFVDQSGTAAQFVAGTSTEVVLEIGQDGVWSYSINGVHENSGMLPDGFDLSQSYHLIVYAQARAGTEKSFQSLKLEEGLAAGDRADWLRGTWGITWTPSNYENGAVEGVSIDPYIEQMSELKTISHIQVKLGSSYIFSPVFAAPHQILESFWHDDGIDRDADGNPIKNLLVPRWVDNDNDGLPDEDPFLNWLQAIKAAGLKTQVYVNSSNMLQRHTGDTATYPDGRLPNPASIGDATQRWKEYCDANLGAFIASRDYHTGTYNETTGLYENAEAEYPERKYLFCFAEVILKEYALRYGDLIDSWVFDSGEFLAGHGDNARNGILEDQRIYEAFGRAVRAGNPNTAVSFNNGPNRDESGAANGTVTPFSQAVHFDDYMFGHPYNGGRSIGNGKNGDYPTNYGRNFSHMQWMQATAGNVQTTRDLTAPEADDTWDWDDQVVGHFYPPMSTTSWQGGATPALLDEDFALWNEVAVLNGGSISWGVAFRRADLSNAFGGLMTASEWALSQLKFSDDHICTLPNSDNPGAPMWARSDTVLAPAVAGQAFYQVLREGVDFWDPEGDDITQISVIDSSGAASWLSFVESPLGSGTWIASGTPTASSDFDLNLVLTEANGLQRKSGSDPFGRSQFSQPRR